MLWVRARPYYNPTTALTQTNNARSPAPSAPTGAAGGGRGAAGLSCIAIEQAIVDRVAYATRSSEPVEVSRSAASP